MNRSIIAAATLAAAFAAPAFAETPGIDAPFTGTLTRAQVQADLAAFQQSGVDPWSKSYDQLQAFRSAKTRAEVQAEFVGARDEVAALNGEDSGAAYLAQAGTQRNALQNLAGTPANRAQ